MFSLDIFCTKRSKGTLLNSRGQLILFYLVSQVYALREVF